MNIKMTLILLAAAVPSRAADAGRKLKESALLDKVVEYVKAHPDASEADVDRLANGLIPKEGLNFKVSFGKDRTDDRLEAAMFEAIEDGQLQNKLGYFRIPIEPATSSSTTCGKTYYLPFVNNPLDMPGVVLRSGPAYFKNHGGVRFDSVALFEKGHKNPTRRWPLPDESEVPVGLSEDGKTLFLQYRLASSGTGWTPVKFGSKDRLILAVEADELRFASEKEIEGQTWDTLEKLPWKGPEASFQAFGVLKARGKDYYFGFDNLCRP